MDISYKGGSSFLITGDAIIAIDPAGDVAPHTLVLHSKRQKAARHLVSGPGEYEISGVLIASLPACGFGGDTLAHCLEVSGVSIFYVPGNFAFDQAMLGAVGRVDVLIVDTEDLKAAEGLVRDTTPRVVLPFGRHTAELASTLGVKDAQPASRFAWNGVSAVPKAVLLKESGARTRRAA